MRADERAAVAADALGSIPDRYIIGNAALFKTGCIDRHHTVRIIAESADRQKIAFRPVHGDQNLTHILRQAFIRRADLILKSSPAFRNVNLHNVSQPALDGSKVHVDDLFTLAGESFDGSGFHIFFGFVDRQYARELEESCLQHRAGTVAEADLCSDAGGVDGVEIGLPLGKDALGAVGEIGFQLFTLPVCVEEEGPAFFHFVCNIEGMHIALLMAGYKVGHCDIVGAADRLMTEAQMASGQTAGLLRIILEISLYVLIGIISDDLAGILVGADSSV